MLSTRLFLVLFLFSVPLWIFGQGSPHVEIQLLSNDQVAELNLDRASFTPWARVLGQRIDSVFGQDTSKRDYMVLVTLHTQASPDISIFARPACTLAELNMLQTSLNIHLPIQTTYCDYSFVFLIKTNEGSRNPNQPFFPEFQEPDKAVHEAFKRAGLSEKKKLLIKWATDEVMPILSETETKIDFKFSGIQYAGRMLRETVNGLPATALSETGSVTDARSEYWRGVMEMSPGNEIITLSKAMMYVANGEFDLAKEYCELIRPFAKEKLLATYYVKELSWRLEEFNKELSLRAERGIAQHEKGNYAGAIAVYDGILADYPRSAWINYELYFSTNLMNNTQQKDSVQTLIRWNAAKGVIFASNPLYPLSARATTGQEGYLLMRRLELGKLFKVKEDFSKDILRLGDIALDLGAYGYAAEVYWLCFSRLKKEELGNREMLPYFLYALEKLGVTDIRKTFNGDFEKEFVKIDKARKKEMEGSPVYKSFKQKGSR